MKVHVEIAVTVGKQFPEAEVGQRYAMTAEVNSGDNPLYVLRAVQAAITSATDDLAAAITAVNGDIDAS